MTNNKRNETVISFHKSDFSQELPMQLKILNKMNISFVTRRILVTHMCVNWQAINGGDNGLQPFWYQIII